jgi:hypothetical protein
MLDESNYGQCLTVHTDGNMARDKGINISECVCFYACVTNILPWDLLNILFLSILLSSAVFLWKA